MSEPITVTAFRGEHGAKDPFQKIQTKLGSISFGSLNAAKTYAEKPNSRNDVSIDPRVMKAELTITNPVINNPDDPFIDFSIIVNAIGLEKAKVIAEEQRDHIFNTDNWYEFKETMEEEGVEDVFDTMLKDNPEKMLNELYIDAYPVFDSKVYVEWFKDAGYDGLVQGGNGETAMEVEYKVFDESQIRVIRTFDLKEPESSIDLAS